MLLKQGYSAVFEVKEPTATKNHLNIYVHIYLIYGREKQFQS